MRHILDDLLLMLQTLLGDARVEVNVSIAPNLPVLRADFVQLQQVMLNLVVNAVDAMRDPAVSARILTIGVTASATEGTVFRLSDTGPGITPAMQEKIFDALFSTKRDGLGMGLAISRSIIENHGGWLRLEAVADSGAHFVFNIPTSP